MLSAKMSCVAPTRTECRNTAPEEIRDARNYVFRYATVSGER